MSELFTKYTHTFKRGERKGQKLTLTVGQLYRGIYPNGKKQEQVLKITALRQKGLAWIVEVEDAKRKKRTLKLSTFLTWCQNEIERPKESEYIRKTREIVCDVLREFKQELPNGLGLLLLDEPDYTVHLAINSKRPRKKLFVTLERLQKIIEGKRKLKQAAYDSQKTE